MNAHLQSRLVIGAMLLGAGVAAQAQSAGSQEVIGEKSIVGEKSSGKTGAQATPQLSSPLRIRTPGAGQPAAIQALPPELAARITRGAIGPMYRPTATKLKQLPAAVGKVQPADFGAPFRVGPGAAAAAGNNWTVSYASFANPAGPAYVFSDDRFSQLAGRVGISFQARPGYRYMIDCAVAEAQEFEATMQVPGTAPQGIRQSLSSGLVSVVTPPVTSAGPVSLGLRATRSMGAFWDWHGCEVTPLRASP